jgi:hypothetical protein
MKAKRIALLPIALTALSAWSQVPKPGFDDKGCSNKPLFTQNIPITGEDYIEVHQLQSYSRSPVYTVRVYGDGRVDWHGETAVSVLGDAPKVWTPPELKHSSRKPVIWGLEVFVMNTPCARSMAASPSQR